MRQFGASEMYALIREVEAVQHDDNFGSQEVVDLHASGRNIWATLTEGEDVQVVEDGKPTVRFNALREQLSSFFSTRGSLQGSGLTILEGDTSPWSRSLLYGEVAGLLDVADSSGEFSEVLWESYVESLPAGFAVETSGRGFVLTEQN